MVDGVRDPEYILQRTLLTTVTSLSFALFQLSLFVYDCLASACFNINANLLPMPHFCHLMIMLKLHHRSNIFIVSDNKVKEVISMSI